MLFILCITPPTSAYVEPTRALHLIVSADAKQCAADSIAVVVKIVPPHACEYVAKFQENNNDVTKGHFSIVVFDPPTIFSDICFKAVIHFSRKNEYNKFGYSNMRYVLNQ